MRPCRRIWPAIYSKLALLMPCSRQSSATGRPPVAWGRTPIIWASVPRLFFIRNLLDPVGEKILLMNPVNRGRGLPLQIKSDHLSETRCAVDVRGVLRCPLKDPLADSPAIPQARPFRERSIPACAGEPWRRRDVRWPAGVEPFAWLTVTLEAIAAGHPARRIDELLPWNFKPRSS
jgi:hypothetical protein